MAKIKICGLSKIEDIQYANEFVPDYIGFVFHSQSKLYVDFKKAEELKKLLSLRINTVGVFVDEKPKNIAALCKKGVIDLIQLHGQENEDYIFELKKNTGKEIIKAIMISEIKSNQNVVENSFDTQADYLLLDSTAGSGKSFDWSKAIRPEKKFFLAGDINRQNTQAAIIAFEPYALDISSGVETDGFKDREKIKAITSLIRRI